MNSNDWNEILFQDDDDLTPFEPKKRSKQSKRKWREIEDIKERQRLKRELMDINEYRL